MRGNKMLFMGYLIFSVVTLTGFVIDVLMKLGGSGYIFERFCLFGLLFSVPEIFWGTYKGIFLRKLVHINKKILLILSLPATILQVIILMAVLFFVATVVITPILDIFGYYVSMP